MKNVTIPPEWLSSKATPLQKAAVRAVQIALAEPDPEIVKLRSDLRAINIARNDVLKKLVALGCCGQCGESTILGYCDNCAPL